MRGKRFVFTQDYRGHNAPHNRWSVDGLRPLVLNVGRNAPLLRLIPIADKVELLASVPSAFRIRTVLLVLRPL